MQAPRSVSKTAVMPSQASQLPQGFGVAVERVVDQYRQCPGTHNHCVWLAELDGRPVAFAMVDLAEGEVFALFVLPSHENLGLGRQLMAVAEAALFEHHDTLFLITDGRDQIRANGFYQRLGWAVVDTAEGDDVRYQKHKVQ